jgi:hypothetical protein
MIRRRNQDSRAHGPSTVVDALEIPRRGPTVPLDEILEPPATNRLDLPSGRSIECLDADGRGETVTIRSPRGKVELEVVLTDSGTVLRFDAADLELRSAGDLRVDCDRFEVRSRSAEITSTRGDVRIRANDDVKLNGERVKLNC